MASRNFVMSSISFLTDSEITVLAGAGTACCLAVFQEAPKFQSVFSRQNCQNVRFFQTKDGIRFPAHKYSIETFLIKPGSRRLLWESRSSFEQAPNKVRIPLEIDQDELGLL